MKRTLTAATALALGGAALLVTASGRRPDVLRVDFGVTRTAVTRPLPFQDPDGSRDFYPKGSAIGRG